MYGKIERYVFKGLFLFFFLLALISGAIGFVGNGLLSSGLPDSVDFFAYGIAAQLEALGRTMNELNEILVEAGQEEF
eukprot:SAG11_NODE_25455_length_358_cov_1.254826_1_plen_76_part_01